MLHMTYILECLPLTSTQLQPIERYYKELIPQSTARPAVYLLLGALLIEATVHIKTLTLFRIIMRRKGSVEYQLMERQLAIKGDHSVHVRKILKKYDLQGVLEMLHSWGLLAGCYQRMHLNMLMSKGEEDVDPETLE